MIAWAFVPGFPGNQTSLNPVGPGAAHIERDFALIFWITSIVYLLVMTVLIISVWRRRDPVGIMPAPQITTDEDDRFARRSVLAAMVGTVILLFVMLIGSFMTSHALGKMKSDDPLTIDVYGHQWWWEVQYPNAESYKIVETANEIHLPVGVPVRIHGTSRDVIHSFWAPNVQGKRDLIPGYETDIMIQIDKAGDWRGQCAEFCGMQHAHMSFFMVAESRGDFDKWLSMEAMSASAPSTPQTQNGQQIFLTHQCVLCHTIRGTKAGSRIGPDLTHLASRSTIAAGTLPNTVGNLAGWILNAQNIKPGCRMPPNQVSGSDLQDLLAYLETLK